MKLRMSLYFLVEWWLSLANLPTKGNHGFTLMDLETINQKINRMVTWTSDPENHGSREFWQTPTLTMASGKGDCDDYAIAKWKLCLDLGISRSQLSFLICDYLPAVERGENGRHMVLQVALNGEVYILDNIETPNGDYTFKTLRHRTDLKPIATIMKHRGNLNPMCRLLLAAWDR